MNFDALSNGVLFSAALLSSVTAQAQPESPALAWDGVVPIHDGYIGTSEVREPHAAGASYKVWFGPQMTFVPYLGVERSESVLWSFMLESHGPEGRQATIDRESIATHHSETRFEYRFGARGELRECYDVLAQGLEQTFVLTEPPALGGGDGFYTLCGRVDTGLAVAPRGFKHAAVDYVDSDGAAVLRYGAATVIDASGEALKIETAVERGQLRLRVPERWLETARYPVVVDPLLGTVGIAGLSGIGISDVVYDDANNQFLAVYARAVSSTDRDVYAVLTDGALGSRQVVFSDLSSADSPIPAVATAGPSQDYLVAFSTRGATLSRIRYTILPSNITSFQSGSVGLPTTSGQHFWRPDVGGSRLTGSPQWVITAQFDQVTGRLQDTGRSRVWAQFVSPGGVGTAVFLTSAVIDADHPSVNKARSPSDVGWAVAWQALVGVDDQIEAAIVSPSSGVGARWQSPNSSQSRIGPRVAGSGGRYLVAYAMTGTSSNLLQGNAVGAQRLDGQLNPVGGETLPRSTTSSRGYIVGDVAYDFETRSHWSVQIVTDTAFGADGRVNLVKLGFDAEVIEDARTWTGPLSNSERPARGGVGYVADGNRFVTVWSVDATTNDWLFGVMQSYPSGGGGQPYGAACNPVGIEWVGRAQIGSEFSAVRVTGAPSNAIGSIVLARAADNFDLGLIGFPGCRALASLTSDFITAVPITTGSTGVANLSTPLDSGFPPTHLYFQAWFLSASGIRQSRGLDVNLVR